MNKKQFEQELKKRGYTHRSPLPIRLAKGKSKQDIYVDSPKKQIKILKNKMCNCKV